MGEVQYESLAVWSRIRTIVVPTNNGVSVYLDDILVTGKAPRQLGSSVVTT